MDQLEPVGLVLYTNNTQYFFKTKCFILPCLLLGTFACVWNVRLCCYHIFTSLAGTLLDDLHMFDLETKFWFDLSGKPGAPSPRYGLGFAGSGSRLFVFGGAYLNLEYEGE